MYAKLFSKTLDAEKEKGPELKTTTLKVKSATMEQTQGETSGIQDLKHRIDDLTTVVNSANYGGARPKPISNANSQGNTNNGGKKGQASGEGSQPRPQPNKPPIPYKGKGLATTSAGPFKDWAKPYQCYTYSGWGHSWHQCPSLGGLDWMGLNRSELPPRAEEKDHKNQKK